MKKIISSLLLLICIMVTQTAIAAIPTVHLKWTIADTTGITKYKLYYSNQSDMSAKIWHQQCDNPVENPPGAFSMTCANVPINAYPAYIQVAGQLTDQSEITSNIQTIPTDPTPPPVNIPAPIIQFLSLETTPPPPPLQDGSVFYWSLNTLPITTATPEIGNVTITKHQNAGTSTSGVDGNCLMQTGSWQAYRFPMTIVPASKGKITFWAKHTFAPNSNDSVYRYFFRSTNSGQANTIAAYTYSGNLYFYIYDSSGTIHRALKVADTWNLGVWSQYEFSWDGSAGAMAIKRDGTIVGQLNTTSWGSAAPVWGTQDFFIGYSDPLGSLDELTI